MKRLYLSGSLYYIGENMPRKLCTVCKSDEIKMYAGGHTNSWQCMKCGYVGALVVEED